ncbi:MFS transporter [Cellulomonas soli]
MRPAVAVAATGTVGLVVAATVHAHEAWLYAAAVVTGAAIGSFGSLVRARWTTVLGGDPRRLHTAYSLESALDELVFIVGPVLATVLATSVTPTAGLVVPLVGMLVGGYWFLSLRASEPAVAPHGSPTARIGAGQSRHDRAGRRVRRHGRDLRRDRRVHRRVRGGAGRQGLRRRDPRRVRVRLDAVRPGVRRPPLGPPAVAAVRARHGRPGRRRLAVRAGQLLGALAAVMFVTGIAIAPTLVNGNALVQDLVAPARLTEGLTWVGTSLGVGVSVGSSVAGSRIDADGSHAGFLVVVAAAAAAVVATLVALPTLRPRRPAPDAGPEASMQVSSPDQRVPDPQ